MPSRGTTRAVLALGVSSFLQSSVLVIAAAGAPTSLDSATTASVRGPSEGAGSAEATQEDREGFSDSGWAKPRFKSRSSARTGVGPRKTGRRLLVASAILGGVALTLNTTRVAVFAVGCNSGDGCFGSPSKPGLGTGFLGWPALILNLTGAGLAAGGGYRRGFAGSEVSPVIARRHVAWGSVMVGVGVAAQIASALLVLSVWRIDSDEIYDRELDPDDFRRRYIGASFGAQAGATLTAAGGGLLFHGMGQRRRASDVEVGFSATGFSLRF